MADALTNVPFPEPERERSGGSGDSEMDVRNGLALKETRVPGNAKHLRTLVTAIWILAVFAAFLFGATIVHISVAKSALDASKRQAEAIAKMDQSLQEVRRSMAELSKILREMSEMEQDEGLSPRTPTDGGSV